MSFLLQLWRANSMKTNEELEKQMIDEYYQSTGSKAFMILAIAVSFGCVVCFVTAVVYKVVMFLIKLL